MPGKRCPVKKSKVRLKLHDITEEEAQLECLDTPRILPAEVMHGSSVDYRPNKPLDEIRVQFPIEGTDWVTHVDITKWGTVEVSVRHRRWKGNEGFRRVGKIRVKEEMTMRSLAK